MRIALVEPQIPQNTGSIARTCAATNTPLHIIGKTPFEISEKSVRRAGLDYWPWVTLVLQSTWQEFTSGLKANSTLWYLSTHGKRSYWEASFTDGDVLVFGSETKGLGQEFLQTVPANNILSIPMIQPAVRSLNLSNAVSIVLYEALRQCSTRTSINKNALPRTLS